MHGLELHLADWTAIGCYLSVVMAVGMWAGRFTKTTQDYFFAGQRFSWWLAAVSCVATLVGSYSFQQYSETGFKYGFCSMMPYTNEWFVLPLFLLGWLPLIYYSRVRSVPEYFERRFDRRTRLAELCTMLVYLVVYIAVNLLTIGLLFDGLYPLAGVVESLLTRLVPPAAGYVWVVSPQVSVAIWAGLLALVTGIYMHSGGQNTVMLTDLLQGGFLLVVGLVVVVVGLVHLGGWEPFWAGLPQANRWPLAPFNHPPGLNAVGDFWSDGIAGTFAFYMINQGIMMRFLSVRSVREARLAMVVVVLLLMPLAAIAVSGAGWIGRSMVSRGEIAATPPGEQSVSVGPSRACEGAITATEPTGNSGTIVNTANEVDDATAKRIFLLVARRLFNLPGSYGLVLAAVIAALLSTLDTYVTAVSGIAVNDIWRKVKPGQPDGYYLRAARWTAAAATVAGFLLVPLFGKFDSIYQALSFATSALNPPLIVVICLGMCWRKFSARAAFWTMVIGDLAMVASVARPALVLPFGHGTLPDNGFPYLRALFGLVASALVASVVQALDVSPRLQQTHRRAAAWAVFLASLAAVFALAPAINTNGGGNLGSPPGRSIPWAVTIIAAAGAAGWLIGRWDTAPRHNPTSGLDLTTLDAARRHYKGGPPSQRGVGNSVYLPLRVPSNTAPVWRAATVAADALGLADGDGLNYVRLPAAELARLEAAPGDLVYVTDARWWLGGFRSIHTRLGPVAEESDSLWATHWVVEHGHLLGERPVRVEKIM